MKTLFTMCLLVSLVSPYAVAKPGKKKPLSEEVSAGLDQSLKDLQQTVEKIQQDLRHAQQTGAKKSDEEIAKTKATLEKLKDYLRNLSSSVTDEIDATVKKLNKMAPDVE